ncbi:MAG: glutamate synthase subunit alpha, partial [Gemmatimonadales bacterium]
PDVPRAGLLDLSGLLAPAPPFRRPRHRGTAPNVRPDLVSLDEEILTELDPALQLGRPFAGRYAIGNHHLTVGARIAGHVARRLGGIGLDAPVRLRFRGSAGQSFGAFAVAGLRLELEGEANDHVGKGLCGGEITIRPFRDAAYAGGDPAPVILGNTALYGATAGRLFAAGAAGDRFAVRNSGAVAVIEGAGHHCCEYMTGGVVVVLGPVGPNLGAGMSSGVAYVLDEAAALESRCNPDMVSVSGLDREDEKRLHALVRAHAAKTGSARARRVLEHWQDQRARFRKVLPRAPAPLPAPRPKRPHTVGATLAPSVEVRS